jgi:hypothetical protein
MPGVPNTFANASGSIPLSQLDANFNTTLTIGTTSVGLGNTISTISNVAISTGSVNGSPVGNVTPSSGAFTTLSATGNVTVADGTVSVPAIAFTADTDSGIYRIGANNIGVGVNGAKVLDIGTTGLGVTGNLTNANQVITASNSATALEVNHSGSGQQGININMTNASYAGTAFYLNTTRSANAAFDLLNLQTNGTTRFRVDGLGTTRMGPASGALSALVVGASANYAMQVSSDGSASSQAALFILNTPSTSTVVDVWDKNTTGDNRFLQFFTESAASLRGSITYNRGGGVVAYNTTSDYRAKTIYGPLTDTGATIDALKVYRGKMHGATVERPMLIAHEAQEVVPYAVNGEKDELDEKGNPKYQTMDHQILVPLLIAEVQALRARVSALEAQI